MRCFFENLHRFGQLLRRSVLHPKKVKAAIALVLAGLMAWQPNAAYAYPSPQKLVTEMSYDQVGNMSSRTDANGNTILYEYDKVNRPVRITYPDGKFVAYEYDANGNRTRMEDWTGVTTYTYDEFNRITQVTYPTGKSVIYQYDVKGNITRITRPDGSYIDYTYTEDGLIETVTDSAGTTTYTYNAGRQVSTKTLPNGVITTHTYDPDGRLTDLVHRKSAGQLIVGFHYTLDAVGNRTRMEKETPDGTAITNYGYDKLYRLTHVEYPDGRVVDYEYDGAGNRTRMTEIQADNNKKVTNYTYDLDNRLLTSLEESFDPEGQIIATIEEQFKHDKSGRLIQQTRPDRTISYRYDYEDRLTYWIDGTTAVEFAYNGDGVRVQKKVGTKTILYTQDINASLPYVLSEDIEDSGATTIAYTRGRELLTQKKDGASSFYLQDALGSVVGRVNQSATLTHDYEYDAFGETRDVPGLTDNDEYRFTGEQNDVETGIIYLRARYYSPRIGRFLSADKLVGKVSEPITRNGYIYVSDNPVNLTDPSGQIAPLVAGAIVFTAVLGGIGAAEYIAAQLIAKEEINPLDVLAAATGKIAGGWTTLGTVVFSPLTGPVAPVVAGAAPAAGGIVEHTVFTAIGTPNFKDEGLGGFAKAAASGYDVPIGREAISYGRSPSRNVAVIPKPDRGGVYLTKAATFLGDINDITGATFDPVTGQIVVQGNQDATLPKMDLEDLVVAIKAVYEVGESPGVTIGTEPSGVEGMALVGFWGGIENTHFGWILFEADRLLKDLFVGRDGLTNEPVIPSVPGFRTLADLMISRPDALQLWQDGWWGRCWFEPKQVTLVRSSDGDSIVFQEASLDVLQEFKSGSRDGPIMDVPEAEVFVNHLEEHYDEFAADPMLLIHDRGPSSFAKMKKLMKIVAIVKWLKDNNIPIDLSWIDSYELTSHPTPMLVPWAKGDPVVKDGWLLNMWGGVSYNLYEGTNFSSPVDDVIAEGAATAAIESQPEETDLSWSYSEEGEEKKAVAVSLAPSTKDGKNAVTHRDIEVSATGDVPLELVRYYNSFDVRKGLFGYGWHLAPYEVRFPLPMIRNPLGGSQAKAYPKMNLVDRGNQRTDTFELTRLDGSGRPTYTREASADQITLNADGTLLFTQGTAQHLEVEFNSSGLMTIMRDSNGNTIRINYAGGLPSSVTHSEGATIAFAYDGNGQVVSAQSSNGRVATYTYDINGNLATATALGRTLSYGYDADHGLVEIEDPSGSLSQDTYDAYGRVANKQVTSQLSLDYDYSLAERKTVITDSEGNQTNLKFDEKYRLTEQTNPLGNTTKVTYDGDIDKPSTVQDARGNTTAFTYNSAGQVRTVTDAEGNVRNLWYDSAGRALAVREANGTATGFGYDSEGNLTHIYNGVTLNLGSSGELISFSHDPNNITTITYNSKGNVISAQDANGNGQNMVYDTSGNPTRIENGSGQGISQSYDNLGRLATVSSDVGGTVHLGYDNADNITSITTNAGVTRYTYDARGNVTSVTDANGYVTSYEYDTDGNLVKVTDAENGVTNYSYDAYGNLIRAVLPNGSTTEYAYDSVGHLVRVIREGVAYEEEGDITPPSAPLNLTVSPAEWSNSSIFKVSWTNPVDFSKIAGAHCKIGSPPVNNTEGQYYPDVTSISVDMDALGLEGEQEVYVWLEDNAGNADYNKSAKGLIKYDKTPPPQVTGLHPTDRLVGAWSNDGSIDVGWDLPIDMAGGRSGSGIAGYSCAWTLDEGFVLDASKDIEGADVTARSPLVNDGTWYFHIRAVDVAGNWADENRGVVHLGPFIVDRTSPRSWHEIHGEEISLFAGDGTGSGVEFIKYRVDGGTWQAFSVPFTAVLGSKIEYYAHDNTGNDEAMHSFTAGEKVNQPPVVQAGGPYVGNEGSPITFNAGGSSDPDGDLLEYRWDFDSDGTYDTEWSAEPTASRTWYDDYTGTVTLEIRDPDGLTDSNTASVNVHNISPVASAINNGPVDEGSPVTVNASQIDPGTDTFTYSFNWDNDGTWDIVNQSSSIAIHTYMENGTYPVRVEVKDDNRGVGEVITEVTIRDLTPVAHISGPEVVYEISPVNFDASGTVSHPDKVMSYEWDWDYNGITFNVLENTGTESTATHTWVNDGVYTVAVRVTDDDGSVGIATLGVTVKDSSPSASITSPESDSKFYFESTISLNGTGDDPQDGILPDFRLSWSSNVDGYLGAGSSLNVIQLSEGIHTITLTVTDSSGMNGSDSINIEILPAGYASCNISQPGDSEEYVHGEQITFVGSAQDAFGERPDSALSWSSNRDGELGVGKTLVVNSTDLSVGTHTVTLTATSTMGKTSNSSITVKINSKSPEVVISAPSNGSKFTKGEPIVFNGSGTDLEDGNLAGESLRWNSNKDGILGTGTSITTASLSSGEHTITLIASDSAGLTSSTYVNITVVSPTVSITSPREGQEFVHGESISLTGSGMDASGERPDTAFNWSSNLDGDIGQGKDLSINSSALSLGEHSITLTVDTSGISVQASVSIKINSAPPTATIISPIQGAIFAQDEEMAFSGEGADLEDGILSEASLVWTSSLDGYLGSGSSFDRTNLSPGTHTITLKVTDSHSLTYEKSVNIIVVALSADLLNTLSDGSTETDLTFTGGGEQTFYLKIPKDAKVTYASVDLTGWTMGAGSGAIAGGAHHSMFLKADGSVWAWGYNTHGELGDGTTTYRTTPVQVNGLTNVIAIAAGGDHSLALKSDGTVWTWGRNQFGKLGDGTTTDRYTPVQVSGLTSVIAISGGHDYSVALKVDGTVWAWGGNAYGQLGDGTTTDRYTPVQVSGLTGVSSIAGGGYVIIALKTDGTVWTWGRNFYGELGDGTTTDRHTPVQVSGLTGVSAIAGGGEHGIALKSDGTVWTWGENAYGQLGDGTTTDRTSPVQVSGLTGVSAIAGGGGHSITLKTDGTVLAWGYNLYGQLGDGTNTDRTTPVQVSGLTGVSTIAGGGYHNLALKSDGTVWAWGRNSGNNAGAIGDGTTIDRSTPVQVSGLTGVSTIAGGVHHSIGLKSDGTVWAWGYNASGQLGDGTTTDKAIPVRVNGLTEVNSVAAGSLHSVALKTDGTVWAWGYNEYGQLGDGTTADRTTPVQVNGLTGIIAISAGAHHNIALKTDGTVWAWGRNMYGALGDGTTTKRLTPVQISGLTGVSAIGSGEGHSVALKTDGSVWTWGYNEYGQLGDGTNTDRHTPAQISGLTEVTAIASGHYHTSILKSDGTVWSTGENGYGQLGDGSITNRSTLVQASGLTGVIAIAGGWIHTVALKSDGTVWAWGFNDEGGLGDGSTTNRSTPVQVSGLTEVSAIEGGGGHTLATKTDGTIWAWGRNSYGQIGDGSTTARYTPVQVNFTVGWHAIASHASAYHSLALKNDGTLYVWGYNNVGQLGDGTITNKNVPIVATTEYVKTIAAGARHTIVSKVDGTVWAWGDNGRGQLGDGTNTHSRTPVLINELTGVTALAAGDYHSVALKSDGTVWVWGNNRGGAIPGEVPGITNVVAIAAGDNHSMAIRSDGTVWAWGDNTYGQLGDGTTTYRSVPVQVSGLTGVNAVAAGRGHSLALKTDGTVWAWGWNEWGQLGTGTRQDDRHFPIQVSGVTGISRAIAAGLGSSYVLKDDGTVWAWGDNAGGQLGDGTTTIRLTPVEVSGLANVSIIAAGAYHCLALKNDGTIWAWGYNGYGQLGNGTTIDRYTPVQLNLVAVDVGGGGEVAFPVNPSLDVGRDGDIQWSYAGEFKVTETTPDFANELNEYVTGHSSDEDGNVLVPLVLRSDSAGTIRVSNVNIQYLIPDKTPPTIKNASILPNPAEYTGQTLSIAAEVTDNDEVKRVTANLNGSDISIVYNSASGLYEGTTEAPAPGDYTLTIVAEDAAGLTATVTIPLSVSTPYPELYPANVSITPDPAIEDTRITVKTDIYNLGRVSADDFEVRLLVDGTTGTTNMVPIVSVQANSYTTTEFAWMPTEPGNHILTIQVDVSNKFSEINEINNNIDKQIVVLDNTPPLIQSLDVTQPVYENESIAIRAQVTDNVAVKDVIATLDSKNIPLVYVTASGLYEVTTDAPHSGNYTLNIKATDVSGLISTTSMDLNVSQRLADISVTTSDISFNPVILADGKSAKVNVIISNVGDQSANNFKVELWVDNLKVSENMASVSSNSNVSLQFDYQPKFGSHSITVKLDAENIVIEKDETNNQATKTVFVIDDTAPVIQNLSINEPIFEGESLIIKANVTDNVGIRKVEVVIETATVILTYNPSTGEFETTTAAPHSGEYIVRLKAYDTSDISAVLEKPIIVMKKQPDLTIGSKDLTLTPELCSDGEEMTITAIVHNNGGENAGNFKVEISIDGQPIDNISLSLDANSNHTVQFTWNAIYGDHMLEVILDPEGTVTESDETNNKASKILFVSDTTPPPAPALTVSPSKWTTSTSHTVSWEPVTDKNGIARYEYSINGNPWVSVGVNTSFVTPALPTGIHMVYVRAVDVPGNAGLSAGVNIYIDTVAPNVPSILEKHCGVGWTVHDSPYFTWVEPGDLGSGIHHYMASVDGGEPFDIGKTNFYHPTFSTGEHTFMIYAIDYVGHQSNWSNALTVKIDLEPPATPVITSTTHTEHDIWYSVNTPVFSWNIPDDRSGISGYYYKLDRVSNTVPDGFSPWTNQTTYQSPPLTDGIWYLHLVTMDNVGHFSNESAHYEVRIDTTPPITTDDAPSGWQRRDFIITLVPSDSYSGVASTKFKVNDTVWQDGTSIPINVDGEYIIQYYSVDNAANVEITHTVNVALDKTPPVILHQVPALGEIGIPLTVTADVTDNFEVVSVDLYYKVAGTEVYAVIPMNVVTATTYSAVIPGSSFTNLGVEYYIKATDQAGNITTHGTESAPHFIPTDNIPPEITDLGVLPNPFKVSESPAISYKLYDAVSREVDVTISIYDTNGLLVKSLFSGKESSTGVETHVHIWDGLSDTGTLVLKGTYECKISATDLAGNTGRITGAITRANALPSITTLASDDPKNEGELVTVNMTAVDIDPEDSLTYSFDWENDGIYDMVNQSSSTASHVYFDNGIYTIGVKVSDNDGGSDEKSLSVTINNIEPVVDAGYDKTVDENTAVEFKVFFSDPGSDTHIADIDFGDGSTSVKVPVTEENQEKRSISVTHIYELPSVYTVTITVTDDDGGTGTDILTVTVQDAAFPNAILISPSVDNAGLCSRVSGKTAIVGIANDEHSAETDSYFELYPTPDNFAYYKLEYAQGKDAKDNFIDMIGEVTQGIISPTKLTTWDTSSLEDGWYTLKLTVTEKTKEDNTTKPNVSESSVNIYVGQPELIANFGKDILNKPSYISLVELPDGDGINSVYIPDPDALWSEIKVEDGLDLLLVTDTNNDRVVIYKTDGNSEHTEFIGTIFTAGEEGKNKSKSQANDGENKPNGIVAKLDDAGSYYDLHLYLADRNNDRVLKITPYGSEVLGTSSNINFNKPTGLALDSSGNIYVADRNNDRIVILTPDGILKSTILTEMNEPTGVYVADKEDNVVEIYVTDRNNDRILKFDAIGQVKLTIGSGEGQEQGALNKPMGVIVNQNGYIFVSDENNDRIQKFDKYGNFVGEIKFNPEDVNAFNKPIGLAVDSKGEILYVVDRNNDSIKVFKAPQE